MGLEHETNIVQTSYCTSNAIPGLSSGTSEIVEASPAPWTCIVRHKVQAFVHATPLYLCNSMEETVMTWHVITVSSTLAITTWCGIHTWHVSNTVVVI